MRSGREITGGVAVHRNVNLIVGSKTGICAASLVVVLSLVLAAPVLAQTSPPSDPNPGAITFTGGIDVPSVYVFRGIVQESDPGLTQWPYGDVGLSKSFDQSALKSVGVNVGVWHSLHTGSSGLDGPRARMHYEEDFYASLGLGFGRGVSLATTFTAYTSPNGMFNTVKEVSVKLSKAHMLAPYTLVAFELSGQADAGLRKGTYLELGIGPSWPVGRNVTFALPVKLGMSLNDYYEIDSVDSKFGFLDVGGLATLPLSRIPSSLGAWNVHGGASVLTFGDTTRFINGGDRTKLVGLFGVGVTY